MLTTAYSVLYDSGMENTAATEARIAWFTDDDFEASVEEAEMLAAAEAAAEQAGVLFDLNGTTVHARTETIIYDFEIEVDEDPASGHFAAATRWAKAILAADMLDSGLIQPAI